MATIRSNAAVRWLHIRPYGSSEELPMSFPKRRAAAFVAVTLTAALSAGSAPPTAAIRGSPPGGTPGLRADAVARIDAALAPVVSLEGLSGTLLVAQAGTTVMTRSYGWADAANGARNRVETRFRIGSITKQFTAMAVLLLQEQGKLRVTDQLCDHLASCPEHWRPITLHHLLAHTSGIANHYARIDVLPHHRAITSARLVTTIAGWPLEFPAGSRFRYSNSGYAILGHVIERASHRSYADFLRAAILDPLGLHNTGYDDRPIPPIHAIGYRITGAPADADDASVAFATGAMYSTVEDMARWTHTLMDRRFASRASVDAMLGRQVSWCDSEGTLCRPGQCELQPLACGTYGYGWDQYTQQDFAGDGDKVIEHSGSISGFRAGSRYYPDRKLYMVILMNSETLGSSYIFRTIWDAATSTG
jgi:D-alanyl-D-alanine carboxypeptidase